MKVASIITALALFAIACSSTTTTSEPTTEQEGTNPKKDAGAKEEDKPTKPAPVEEEEPEPEPLACSEESTPQACVNCCAQEHQAGVETYLDAYDTLINCLCQPSKCATECAESTCSDAENPPEPTEECLACEEAKGTECQQQAGQKCSASQDCIELNNCLGTCQ
ncbi:MAG TPA: hypothetical protein VM580_18160 [Labilithrix sp.]|nr:hypothetical protein [Labilithrix sp.]